jgi:hypothetical protein
VRRLHSLICFTPTRRWWRAGWTLLQVNPTILQGLDFIFVGRKHGSSTSPAFAMFIGTPKGLWSMRMGTMLCQSMLPWSCPSPFWMLYAEHDKINQDVEEKLEQDAAAKAAVACKGKSKGKKTQG